MKPSTGDRIVSVIIHILLIIIGFVSIYPFWNAAVISFNNGIDALKGGITFWPREFTLDNYKFVFKDKRLINGFIISVLRTGLGTAGAILCTSIFAYGMSKRSSSEENSIWEWLSLPCISAEASFRPIC